MSNNEILLIRKQMMTLIHKVESMEGTIDNLKNSIDQMTDTVSDLTIKLAIFSQPDYIGKANLEYEKTKGE